MNKPVVKAETVYYVDELHGQRFASYDEAYAAIQIYTMRGDIGKLLAANGDFGIVDVSKILNCVLEAKFSIFEWFLIQSTNEEIEKFQTQIDGIGSP